jgi:hypothetical protein
MNSTENPNLLIFRQGKEESKSLDDDDSDERNVLEIPMNILLRNSRLFKHCLTQRNACKFVTEQGVYLGEMTHWAKKNKFGGHQHIMGLDDWQIYNGVRTFIEWVKHPGFLWDFDNIHVIGPAIHVAEWLLTPLSYKKRLAKRMKLLEERLAELENEKIC